MILLSNNETFPYVLLAERSLPIEDQTIWKLRSLGATDRASIEDEAARFSPSETITGSEIRITRGAQALRTVKLGLADVENVKNADGTVAKVPFEVIGGGKARREVTNAFLNQIPFEVVTELARAIVGGSSLTEGDAGN